MSVTTLNFLRSCALLILFLVFKKSIIAEAIFVNVPFFSHLRFYSSCHECMYLDSSEVTRISEGHWSELLHGNGADYHLTTSLGVKPPTIKRKLHSMTCVWDFESITVDVPLFQLTIEMDSKFCCNWLKHLQSAKKPDTTQISVTIPP